MREPPCAALARERRQLESEESNAHADIVELKTIVAHLERLRLELTREQAFELRTCEKIRSSERTLARQTQKVLNHLQVTAINYMSNVNIFILDHISYKEPVWRFNVYRS